jgi:uncharacterized protein (DUF885 family)
MAGLAIIHAVASAAPGADESFSTLAARYLDGIADRSPVAATALGDHRADDRLDDVDAAARARIRDTFLDYRETLAGIDRDELSRANQVDAAILHNEIESSLFELDTFEEWAWNPLYYVRLSGNAIYGLLSRDFAPLDERLDNAAARLEQLPRFFTQARGALQPERVPKIHAETAIRQNRGLETIIDSMIVPQLAELPSETRGRLEAAIDTARTAIAEHQAWLEEELLPRANGDFRLGAELYDRKLAFALNSSLSRREIRTLAEREYELVRSEMYEIAKQVYVGMNPYTAFPDNPDEAYKQAIIRAAVAKNIVTMPEEPVEIIVMPEFQRGIALAYLSPPGPLDRDQKAFYAVAPLPADWTDAQVESFLREYNLYSIQNFTIHEAVPGHYLQLALSNRHPSALRSALWSGPFVEGWAVYADASDQSQVVPPLHYQRDHRFRDPRGRHDSGRSHEAHGRGRLPGGTRGRRQVGARAALVSTAFHVLRRLPGARGPARRRRSCLGRRIHAAPLPRPGALLRLAARPLRARADAQRAHPARRAGGDRDLSLIFDPALRPFPFTSHLRITLSARPFAYSNW